MSKKPDTWMPVYVGKYLADTMHLSTAEHGAYLLLLFHGWMHGGVLPLADASLRHCARMSESEWENSRDVVMAFFERTADGYVQKRQKTEIEKAISIVESKSRAGKAGAAARWHKDAAANGNGMREPMANSMAKGLANGCVADAPLHSTPPTEATVPTEPTLPTVEKNKAPRKRGTPIPADFGVSDRVKAWAEGKTFGDLERYAEIFVGRMRASGKPYVDWDEAFMNCIREDWYELRGPERAAPSRASLFEKRESHLGELTGKTPRLGYSGD